MTLAFRARLRLRWRSWLTMALLIAVIGGIVLGLVAAGRRTTTAFACMLAATNGADALVYSAGGFSIPPAAVVHLPEVAQSGLVAFPQAELALDGHALPSSWQLSAAASPSFGTTVERQRLLQGRWPNPAAADQAVLSYRPPNGVHLGSVVHLRFYKPEQAGELFDAFGPIPVPEGAAAAVRVVGIVASPADFPSGGSPSATLYVTPALLREVVSTSAVAYAYAVHLRDGAGDVASFDSAVAHLHGGADLYVSDVDGSYAVIERSIRLQAVAWWILAAIAGLVGLVVIAQLLARQAAVDAVEYPVMRTIGMGSRDLFRLGLLTVLAMALVGGLGAIAVAYALSPLAPIGEAAVAEPRPGFAFDPVALLLGALAVFVVAAVVGAIPARLEASRRRVLSDDGGGLGARRPSLVAGWLARGGAPVSAVVGTRLAFERGRRQTAVPTFAAFSGAALAVFALTATSVFGASLGHLLDSPRLYGGTFDLQIDNPGGTITTIVPALLRYSAISQLSSGVEDTVRIQGRVIDTIAEVSDKGPLLTPPVVSGHAVDGPDQIVLGETTLRQVGAHVGERVKVNIGRRTMPFTVVGTAAFPVFGAQGGLGTGADMTLASYDRLSGCTPRDTRAICILDGAVLNVRPGPGGVATLESIETAYGNGAALPIVPTSLVNFGQSSDLPLALGLAVALFGAASVLHFLIVSVTRRRRDTGILKTLGLLGRQARAVVLWQVTAVIMVSLVIGVPLGIAAGRLAWDLTASDFGVIPDIVIPGWQVAAVVVGSIATGNLLAIIPATVSSGLRPAPPLRAQ
ncbi:MAG: FtsX-like permease family protein [Acidimicrobiales bacterium]